MSHNLFARGRFCLIVDSCWLIRMVDTEDCGCYGNFLKQQWSLPYWLTSFYKQFLGSMQGWLHFTHSRASFRIRSQSSQILPLLYQRSLCNIVNPFYHFSSLHSIFIRSRFYFKKASLLIRKKQLLTFKSFIMILQHSVPSSHSTSNSSSLGVSVTSTEISEGWNQLLPNSC